MTDLKKLKSDIKKWSVELGFDQMGVSGIEVKNDEEKLIQWLKNNHHGSMKYMEKHGKKRARPYELIPGALRVISFRMTYHFFDKELSEKRAEKNGGVDPVKQKYFRNYEKKTGKYGCRSHTYFSSNNRSFDCSFQYGVVFKVENLIYCS